LGFDGYWAAYNFNFDYFQPNYFLGDGERIIGNAYETEFTMKLGLDWLANRDKEKPFALFLSFGPPHDPWEWNNVPEHLARQFSSIEFPFPATYRDGSAEYWEPSMDRAWWLSTVKPNLQKWQAVYAAMVASIDGTCGTLLARLQQENLLQDTLFVFTSDHGEMFGAHGRCGCPFCSIGQDASRQAQSAPSVSEHPTLCRHCWERWGLRFRMN
jgi:arylsulfatase A-like enzyme